uniref:Uncharacterized protein n=1 Tax=Tolypothrix bouteillei VB521301 TaxID=1479485 RepID=A0A0C1R6K7_9CYAN
MGASTRAKKVTTLEAVPPGLAPTRITPNANIGGNFKTVAANHPTIGMIVNCSKTPKINALPAFRKLCNCCVVIVKPIPNITTPSAIEMLPLPLAAIFGKK